MTAEIVFAVACCAAGNFLAVWGIVRHELNLLRLDVRADVAALDRRVRMLEARP
jgi:hypothetical protein